MQPGKLGRLWAILVPQAEERCAAERREKVPLPVWPGGGVPCHRVRARTGVGDTTGAAEKAPEVVVVWGVVRVPELPGWCAPCAQPSFLSEETLTLSQVSIPLSLRKGELK